MKTKAELRTELEAAKEQFFLAGGRITKCEPQVVRTKHRASGTGTRNRPSGGHMPSGVKSSMNF